MTTAGATASSPDTDPNPADPDAAIREALLSQLTRYVDEICRSVEAAAAAGVDPVAPVASAWPRRDLGRPEERSSGRVGAP